MEPGGKPRGGCALCWRCMQLVLQLTHCLVAVADSTTPTKAAGTRSLSPGLNGTTVGIASPDDSPLGDSPEKMYAPLRCNYGAFLVAPRLIDRAARMDSAEEGRNLGRSFAEQADEDMHEETHKPTISVTLSHGKVRAFPAKTSVRTWYPVCSRCAGLGAGADAEEGALETASAARHAAGSIWPLHVSATNAP